MVNTEFWDRYPNLRLLLLDSDPSGVDGDLDYAEECLGAEGVSTEDVAALDAWIATLLDGEREALLVGDDEELAALIADSPRTADGEGHVVMLLNDIWEVL